MDCVFCSIIKGDIPAVKIYEDEKMLIIKDIDPKANIHLLALPKEHYATLEEASDDQLKTVMMIFKKINELKQQLGIANGYRLVINCGEQAGQTIHHLHIHILGGQELIFEDLRTLTL